MNHDDVRPGMPYVPPGDVTWDTVGGMVYEHRDDGTLHRFDGRTHEIWEGDHYAVLSDDLRYDDLSPWRNLGSIRVVVFGKFQNGFYRKRRNAWFFALLGLPIGYSMPSGEKNVHRWYYWRRGLPHRVLRHG